MHLAMQCQARSGAILLSDMSQFLYVSSQQCQVWSGAILLSDVLRSLILKEQGTTFAEAIKKALAAKGLSVSDCFFQEPNSVLVTFATFKDHDITSYPDFNLIVQAGQPISLSIAPV